MSGGAAGCSRDALGWWGRWFYGGIAALLAVALLGACRGPSSEVTPLLPVPGAEGRWKMEELTTWGASEILAASEGRALTVVALWASWCAPCVEEMGVLDGFARANPAVLVVGLGTDDVADFSKAQRVLDLVRPQFPQARLGGGEPAFLEALKLPWDGMLPKTVVLLPGAPARLMEPPVTLEKLNKLRHEARSGEP